LITLAVVAAAALKLAPAAPSNPPTAKPAAATRSAPAPKAATPKAGAAAAKAKRATAGGRAPQVPAGAPEAAAFTAEERSRLVREKCTRCHGFDRAVNTRLTPADWKRHLKKMSLRPNTAVSDEQASAILDFLKSYSPPR
jgi:hypothetical protein